MWVLVVMGAVIIIGCARWRRSGQDLVPFLGLGVIAIYARAWHGLCANRLNYGGPKGLILVANHTCSADAAFLVGASARPLSFLVAAEYYRIPALTKLLRYLHCVPVARQGTDVEAVRRALEALHEGRTLVVFPEGGLSNAGRRMPRKGKCGVAYLALRSGAPVIPVGIAGGPQTSATLKAWLTPSRARLRFGEAVDLSNYGGVAITRRILEDVTKLFMNEVARLQAEAEANSRPSRQTAGRTHHDNMQHRGTDRQEMHAL